MEGQAWLAVVLRMVVPSGLLEGLKDDAAFLRVRCRIGYREGHDALDASELPDDWCASIRRRT